MSTITLEIPDTLTVKLAPYQNQLLELLELGLSMWPKYRDNGPVGNDPTPADDFVAQKPQTNVYQVLASSSKVTPPKPYRASKPYLRQTPVPITGKPVSQLVMEERE